MQGFTSAQKMAEESTPVLKESLEKCFIEQQLALKQLTVQYEDLEDKVELVDCFYTQLDGNQEENSRNLEKLGKIVTRLEGHLGKLEDRVEIIDEGDDKRLDLLEERVTVLNVQNDELRDHLNLTINMLNNVTTILNRQFMNSKQADEAIDNTQTANEPADEAIVVDDEPEGNEPTQLTLRQVCDMYQSQPMDEEGWEEMTKAIEAAEEYEASLQKRQQLPIRVNGLTQDEWNDLLRI